MDASDHRLKAAILHLKAAIEILEANPTRPEIVRADACLAEAQQELDLLLAPADPYADTTIRPGLNRVEGGHDG